MKVTCSNCGAEVDVQGNVANCPYCGNQIVTLNGGDEIDNYFDNMAAAQPQSMNDYARAVENGDKKLKKAVKELFSWSIFLLVIGMLRLLFGLLGIEDVETVKSELPSLIDTIYYAPLSSYVSFATAETIMHLLIAVCGCVMVVFVSVLKKTDIYSKNLQNANFKVLVTSCVMAAILLAYFIIEMCAVASTYKLYELELLDLEDIGTSFSSLVWTVLLVVGGVMCVVYSVRLHKQAKNN